MLGEIYTITGNLKNLSGQLKNALEADLYDEEKAKVKNSSHAHCAVQTHIKWGYGLLYGHG